jgi:hypothetical protein
MWLWFISCLEHIVLLMFGTRSALWDINEMCDNGRRIPTRLIYHACRRNRQAFLELCGNSMTNYLMWRVTCVKKMRCVLHDSRCRRCNFDVSKRPVLTSEHCSPALANMLVEKYATCWGTVGRVLAYSWRATQYRWWENVCPSGEPTSAIVLMKANSPINVLYVCPRH